MIVTAQMPKEEGSTVEFSGALLELADVIGEDGVGAKVTADRELVVLMVDSTAFPNKTIWMDAGTAEHLAAVLAAHAAKVRELYG